MKINTDELLALPYEEKIKIIELLQDDLEHSENSAPIPKWIREDIKKRRAEMKDSSFGLSHEELWKQIDQLDG